MMDSRRSITNRWSLVQPTPLSTQIRGTGLMRPTMTLTPRGPYAQVRALATTCTRWKNNSAPLASRFPASFVLPTAIPSVSRMVDAEAQQRRELLGLYDKLNLPPCLYAFAYGSGVFSQAPGADQSKRMIDLIVAVQNPVLWHERNMVVHPDHYPWIVRVLGSWSIRKFQNMGGGLWYNPYITTGDRVVKYGVTSLDTLCNDLLDWNTLYIAGRLQKPVATLIDTTKGRVSLAMQVNLTSALRVAFLLLPERFSERDLYLTIAELSYLGDFRMNIPGGENANKIRNIVDNQVSWFRIMCADLIVRFGSVHVKTEKDLWMTLTQDTSAVSRAQLAARLPLNLRKHLIAYFVSRPHLSPVFAEAKESGAFAEPSRAPEPVQVGVANPSLSSRFWIAAVDQPDFKEVLRARIADIVREPTRTQSLKGIYTAGISRSIRYVWSKVSKVRLSCLRSI